MAKKSLLAMGVVFLMALVNFSAWATVPDRINYQGKLTDSGGIPLSGSQLIRVFIYEQATGGTDLWFEEHTVTLSDDGIYSLQLGSQAPFPSDLFIAYPALYLEVRIWHSGTGWEILEPRQEMISTAFSMKAAKAEDADTLDGMDSLDFADTAHDHSFSDLTGTATDAQIPNDITINNAATADYAASADSADYATSAGDADTVDGLHAAAFAQDSEIMPTVLASDGAGSGLDADRLDNLDSSAFATSTHAHDHGTLTGLGADDHTQYFHLGQNETITGRPAFNGGTSGSTPPFNVDSTYLVANLNADYLDGLNSSSFAAAGHTHDGRYYTESEVNTLVASLQSQITSLQASVNQLTTLLQNVTRAGNDITFSGVNVHVVNGTGTTNGAVNGLGNLIVGYNELRGTGDDRTGSHNIVVGVRQNYSSYGGLVSGDLNTISGVYASVSGGYGNTASGNYASVSGGLSNTASGFSASVSGGYYNTASDYYASVSGGYSNTASGFYSTVSGGYLNEAIGSISSISGGSSNEASGSYASVSGGLSNTGSGFSASVSGGRNNIASGEYSFVSGGGGENVEDGNEAFANYSAILGGSINISGDPDLSDHTIGENSTVSGGRNNTASGFSASVSGGYGNTASGIRASVSGGLSNTASGFSASVSGGNLSEAIGSISSISGGRNNIASGEYSSVSGGNSNTASYYYASISGGAGNTASGSYASVSGGQSNTASETYHSVVGDAGRVYVDSTLVH